MDAKTLAEQAKQEYAKGEFVAAAGLFAQAAQAYNAGQDEVNAAEMKNNESVAYLRAGKADAALRDACGVHDTRVPSPPPKDQESRKYYQALLDRADLLRGLVTGR